MGIAISEFRFVWLNFQLDKSELGMFRAGPLNFKNIDIFFAPHHLLCHRRSGAAANNDNHNEGLETHGHVCFLLCFMFIYTQGISQIRVSLAFFYRFYSHLFSLVSGKETSHYFFFQYTGHHVSTNLKMTVPACNPVCIEFYPNRNR